jgi:hypothetical protein
MKLKHLKLNEKKINKNSYDILNSKPAILFFSSSVQDGYKDKLKFICLNDLKYFIDSSTFNYLFNNEYIDYIKVTQGRKTIFEYDNREAIA